MSAHPITFPFITLSIRHAKFIYTSENSMSQIRTYNFSLMQPDTSERLKNHIEPPARNI